MVQPKNLLLQMTYLLIQTRYLLVQSRQFLVKAKKKCVVPILKSHKRVTNLSDTTDILTPSKY